MPELESPPYPAIHDRIRKGLVVPFLGSGASLGTRDPRAQPWSPEVPGFLPSARELADYLAGPVRYPSDMESPELSRIAQFYELVLGREPLDSDLESVFERQVECTPIHTYLASCPMPLLIITTNYDDLMEQALTAAGKAYDVVVHLTSATLKRVTNHEWADRLLWRPHGQQPSFVTDDELAQIDPEKQFVVYKMHGGIDREQTDRGSFVITEDDYIDFLTRMTSPRAGAIPSFIARHLGGRDPAELHPARPHKPGRHLLFLGYSLRDWNLRVLLNQIDLAGRRSITSWAIQYNPSPLETRFWKRRSENVLVYNMKVEQFAEALQRV